ncbi:MAG: glycosyltransferase family 4 protein, partial [Promethearchaeota archaeon]
MSVPRIGGAQYSTLEFLEFLRGRVEIYVATRKDVPRKIMLPLKKLGVEVLQYTYKEIFNYPYLDIKAINKKIDVIWVADQTFLNIPKLKRILGAPVVVHLRDYAFICPWWTASYGLKEICLRRCSLLRLIKCKQLANRYMADEGLISKFRSNLYRALNMIKGIGDYYTWPLRNKEILDNIDGFIAVSQAVKEIYRSHNILKPIKVIYNPVKTSSSDLNDADDYICKDHEIILTYASGANLIKGPHILLKAVRKLITKGLKLHVVMIGVKNTWIEKLVAKLNLSRHANLLPKLPRSMVCNIMKHSNLVIFPSIWPEPFGRVALEANLL